MSECWAVYTTDVVVDFVEDQCLFAVYIDGASSSGCE